jgi:CHAT domain-containing protein
MIYYFGQVSSGGAALVILLVTDHEEFATAGILADWPPAKIILSQDQHTVETNILSIHVGRLRSSLQRRSLLDLPANEEALALLEADTELFLGGELPNKLAAWHAAGKRHLRISPHGPLHYYPFHLLGPSDDPLASRWCVTVLPNLQLIAPPQHAASHVPSTELSAIGLNFIDTHQHELDPLWEPEPEAASVAEIYATVPLLGPQVTRKTVLDALQVSKRVHIATHGAHDFDAPSFQCIHVNPDAGSPGVIFAYEVLKLDLSGLDLVTLSACETALGRFDNGDNLRGFPAALLAAGVSTIVGTMWPVDTHVAKLFFETFYGSLKSTGQKHQAFYKAQQTVRQSFPEYLDWGAFQLLGRT